MFFIYFPFLVLFLYLLRSDLVFFLLYDLLSTSPVVEHLTLNPKSKGSNPTYGTRRERRNE